jgi:murein DD-endopeptidase MepM/ murein hydrolase activator NlpD
MTSLRLFPRSHLVLAGGLALVLAGVLVAGADRAPASVDAATSGPDYAVESTSADGATAVDDAEMVVTLADLADASNASAEDRTAASIPELRAPTAAGVENPPTVRTETVRPGDSMARIFQRQALAPRTLHTLLDSDPLARRLRQIHPGQELTFVTDEDNQLISLTYGTGPMRSLVFERDGASFRAREVSREPERILGVRQGTINSSLFLAGQAVGLNEDITLRLAQIFQWDIDFVLDIRTGDEFSLLFEELYLDGEFIGFGAILAAEFTNRGRTYRAVRYTDLDGRSSFYTPEGRNMRKAFLRAPLEFTRISSNFNPQRLHPIHNRVVPHRGIDYAAPTGTPVMAAGDGRVITAGRTTPNGNYIILQHGSNIQTKYLHLSRFARGISAGTRVRQGQVIGYVGATGWATAPHLHYEFLVNGVHRNPRTVELPNADPVPKAELDRFHAHTAPLVAMLDSERRLLQLARNL